jgi:hypothetical protein
MKKGMTYGVGTSRFGGAAFTDDGGRRPTVAGDAAEDSEGESMMSDSVAKHMLALVEIMVPRVVSATIAALEKDVRLRRVVNAPTGGTAERQLNGLALARELNCGEWVIYGIKKANRLFHAQGLEPLIFIGRYSTTKKISTWLEAHPDFVAGQVLAPNQWAKRKAVRSGLKGGVRHE